MFKNAGQTSSNIFGVPLSASENGQCIPLIVGRVQAGPRMIWRGNVTQGSSGKKGKGGGGGKKGAKSGPATYVADVSLLLGTCGFGRTRSNQVTVQGLQSIGSIWSNNSLYNVLYGSWTGVVSSGAVTISVPGGGTLIQIIAVSVAQSYSVTFNDYGGPGSISLSGTYSKALWNASQSYYDRTSQAAVAGGGRAPYTFTRTPSISASTTLSIDPGLNGATVTVYFMYVTAAQNLPLGKVRQTFESLLGSSGAVAEPVVYEDVGGIAAPQCDLGTTGEPAQLRYETLGWGTASPNSDVNPVDVIQLLIMGPHGLNASSVLQQTNGPTTILGDFTAMRNYCDANGIWVSCYYDQQTSGSSELGDLFDIANCAPVWSEGVLKAIPYSEISQVGNGATFVAPTAAGPLETLTSIDFVCDVGKAPIKIVRTDQKNSKNILPIEYTDRNNDYAKNEIDVVEGQSISEWGARRDTTRNFRGIMDQLTASIVGVPLVKRSAMREKTVLTFKLSPRHMHREPMDLVAITEPISGLSNYPVILTKASFAADGSLECEAQPFAYGQNAPHSPPSPQSSIRPTNYSNQDPGSVGLIYFLEPVPRLITDGNSAELWIAAAGSGAQYGGCDVWLSVDGGASYPSTIGRILGPSVMGAVAGSTWPAHADPDTSDDLAVDLTGSLGTLDSWPQSAADAFVPLCVVDGGSGAIPYEAIAYTNATLTAAHKYTLKATGGGGNEIRRSVYSAPTVGAGVAHTAGKTFVYLGGPILKVPLDPKWIGKTLYFKFTAFNTFLQAEESLATVSPYTYTVTGVAAAVGGGTVGGGTGGYSISPANPLSQAAVTYTVAMAQCAATFSPSGVVTNYNARSFSVSDPGVGNTQQYWVTIYDPGQVGDTGSGTTLSAYCDTNQTKWNTVGYIRIGTIVVTHTGGVTGGSGGSSSGLIAALTVTDSGDHLTFSLSKPVTLLMLFRNGDFVDPADYTFTGSGFVLKRALAAGENLNALGM
ncbi:MAG: hypothetical protein JWO48_1197 [Bryobacterales bacterium]|nr:hypothetical protein [Bryobacterales bacterium]